MWLTVFIVVLILLSLLYRWYQQNLVPVVEHSPFTLESVQNPEPVELDMKKRKKVLKRKFVAEEVPSNLDAIVIGSGIGGMSAAAILAKAGYKVCVLEQHGRCGGCCHTYEQKGVEFDVGIHYIGDMGANSLSKNLTDQLTNGQLEWTPIDHNFDNYVSLEGGEKLTVPIYGNRKETVNAMKQAFPHDTDAIDKFFQYCEDDKAGLTPFFIVKLLPYALVKFVINTGLINLFTSFFKGSQDSVWDVVCRITDNTQLRTAFVYLFMDYGSTPWMASWPMHSAITRHYKDGAYYPKGGSSQIPLTIVPVIEEAGGAVFMRAAVEQINVDDTGSAVGVRVNGKNIDAPLVISDAGIINTFGKLVPDDIASKSRYKSYVQEVGSGESAFQLFIGLRGTKEELELKSTNYWIYYNSSDLKGSYERYMKQKDLDEVNNGEVKPPVLFLSFPSTKDETWTQRFPNGMSTCVIAGAVNWNWFAGKDKGWEGKKVKQRGEEYEDAKKAFGDMVMEEFYMMFPELAGKVEFVLVGSPLTAQHYIAAPKGEIAGMDHSCYRFSPNASTELRPQTDIPGLYMTGQDIAVCGFSGAMFGGLLCASSILRRNLMADLAKIKAERKRIYKNR